MRIWHDTPDAPRTPSRAAPGQAITIIVGTAPIEPGQRVWVEYQVGARSARADAAWLHNVATSSSWRVGIGPFARGERVTYTVHGRGANGVEVSTAPRSFVVGAKLHVAILWHQHQPSYVDPRAVGPSRIAKPWVRLHALPDYYGMAALAADFPDVHLTINLTPVLVDQIEQYTIHGAIDAALALTATPAEALSPGQQRELLGSFFDADWHHQIFAHARYRELFEQRTRRERFTAQDLTDLQMWFNLAWFGRALRDGDVALPTGEIASVRRFVEQGRGFDRRDIDEMLVEQYKVLRAVVPLHRTLQDRGQIEVSTTPYYHPILPLLIDSDGALLDRVGTSLPARFAHPEDADEQVRRAVDHYVAHFGRRPRGMWPAEGAVSSASVELLERHGVEWIATDAGVLARSGRWGYRAEDPDVACRPFRSGEPGLDIFFRDPELSNEIGFRLHQIERGEDAAARLVQRIEERVLARMSGDGDRILTLALDGENAWGAYPDDGRPFLRALYARLASHPELQTVTFAEYLDGSARGVSAHAIRDQERVYELAAASWADEPGSAPGVDLGTWIGEPEENRAWDLLRAAREAARRRGHDAGARAVRVRVAIRRRGLGLVLVVRRRSGVWTRRGVRRSVPRASRGRVPARRPGGAARAGGAHRAAQGVVDLHASRRPRRRG